MKTMDLEHSQSIVRSVVVNLRPVVLNLVQVVPSSLPMMRSASRKKSRTSNHSSHQPRPLAEVHLFPVQSPQSRRPYLPPHDRPVQRNLRNLLRSQSLDVEELSGKPRPNLSQSLKKSLNRMRKRSGKKKRKNSQTSVSKPKTHPWRL